MVGILAAKTCFQPSSEASSSGARSLSSVLKSLASVPPHPSLAEVPPWSSSSQSCRVRQTGRFDPSPAWRRTFPPCPLSQGQGLFLLKQPRESQPSSYLALLVPKAFEFRGPRLAAPRSVAGSIPASTFALTRRRLRVSSLKVLGASDRLRSVPGRLPGGQDAQKPVQGVPAEEVFGSQHEQRW